MKIIKYTTKEQIKLNKGFKYAIWFSLISLERLSDQSGGQKYVEMCENINFDGL